MLGRLVFSRKKEIKVRWVQVLKSETLREFLDPRRASVDEGGL